MLTIVTPHHLLQRVRLPPPRHPPANISSCPPGNRKTRSLRAAAALHRWSPVRIPTPLPATSLPVCCDRESDSSLDYEYRAAEGSLTQAQALRRRWNQRWRRGAQAKNGPMRSLRDGATASAPPYTTSGRHVKRQTLATGSPCVPGAAAPVAGQLVERAT
jgi:hypothetical protein